MPSSKKVFKMVPKAKNVIPEVRPCSFKAISDKGNKVHGTAAFLVLAKRAGGVDSFLGECVEHAMSKMMEQYGTK